MKNFNLIKRLFMDSHEKQSPQRFARYAAMLIMLLTLGVGQTWAATWSFSGTSYMYFYNKGGWADNGKMLFIGKDSYSSVYTMSAVSNTKLWVVQMPSSGWSDASYMAIAGGSNVWGSGSWGPSNRTNATHHTNTYTSGISTSSTQYYVLIPSSTSNNASISLTYFGNAISKLNNTITVKAKVSTDGGDSYSEATSPGTLSASSKKFTTYNSCASATSLSSGTITCGYTATTTLTAADATGYDFVGWYNSSGTRQTTNKTLTIYPTANATYYAYYIEKQYSLTFSHNGHGTIEVGGSTVASGGTANVNYTTTKTLVATPNTGYNFSGWTKSGSNTGAVTIGNAANASTTIKATNTGATITAGFTPMTTTITLDNQGATTEGSTEVTATYDAEMPAITLPTKTGYTFGGYWGAPSGSGPQYYNADGSSTQNWNNTESTYKLFAKWTENLSTVSLEADPSGKGSFTIGGAAATSTTAGVTTTRSVTAVPIAGYSFTGWSITGGATISSTSTNPTTVTGGGAGTAATLTATFEENLVYYDVTFGVGTSYTSLGSLSATNNTTSSAISSGDDILSASNITFTATPDDYYEVEAWYTNDACTEGRHSAGQTTYNVVGLDDDITVYVKFQPITYDITYTLNGGSNHVSNPASYNYESSAITLQDPSRSGYTFGGWYTESTFENRVYSIAARSNGNKAFWAKWTANTYDVAFNANGGSGSMSNQDFTYDVAQSLTSNAYTRAGYTFGGWATSKANADAGTKAYNNSQSVSNLSSTDGATVTLWAIWTARPYKIVYFAMPQGWTNVYAYTWYSGNTSKKNATYPGVRLNNGAAGTGSVIENGVTYYYYKFYTDGKAGDSEGDGTGYGNSPNTWDRVIFAKSNSATTAGTDKTNDLNISTGHYYWLDDNANSTGTAAAAEWYVKGSFPSHSWDTHYPIVFDGSSRSGSVLIEGLTASTSYSFKVFRASANGRWFKYTGGASASYYDDYDITSLIGQDLTLRIYDDNNNTFTTAMTSYRFSLDVTNINHPVLTVAPGTDNDYSATLSIHSDGHGTTTPAAGGITLHQYTPTSITANPQPGYRFKQWNKNANVSYAAGSSSTSNPASFLGTANGGTIEAEFTQEGIIYFDNTMSQWKGDIYVYLFTKNKDTRNPWWDTMDGSGNGPGIVLKKKNDGTVMYDYYGKMTRIGESNIYYFDYKAAGCSSTIYQVVFTKGNYSTSAGLYKTSAAYRADFNSCMPMYIASQTWTTTNETGYHNAGYWKRYNVKNSGLTLRGSWNSWSSGDEIEFTSTEENSNTFKASVTLGNATYQFKIYRPCVNGSGWLGNTGTMQPSNSTGWEMTETDNCHIYIPSTGTYVFTLNLGTDHIYLSVEYPLLRNDYRLLHSGRITTSGSDGHKHPSQSVRHLTGNNKEQRDTVSFFIDKDHKGTLYLQKCTNPAGDGGRGTWADSAAVTVSLSDINKTGVYNFEIVQTTNGSGKRTVTANILDAGHRKYDGNLYIRTDVADGGWDAYEKVNDNVLIFTEYAKSHSNYDHYHCHWTPTGKNLHFTIATDYSPSISDTMKTGAAPFNFETLPYEASVRFMYNSATNELNRAYLNGANEGEAEYLKIQAMNDSIRQNTAGLTPTPFPAGNHSGDTVFVKFKDLGNWVYQYELKAIEGTHYRLVSNYRYSSKDHLQYFKGSAGTWNASTTELLLGGSGATWQKLRLVYDFKTNNLIAAWMPDGNVGSDLAIHADMMLIRRAQNAATQLTFTSGKKLSDVKTMVGAIEFFKDSIVGRVNNFSGDVIGTKGNRANRELMLYISFPFDVAVNDIYGCGDYNKEWYIQYYDGAERASKGWFKGDGTTTFWKFIDRSDTLRAGVGYSLLLDNDYFNTNNAGVWKNIADGGSVYLFFPSAKELDGSKVIKTGSAALPVPSHECTIDRTFVSANSGRTVNHKFTDSHWNMMGVPLFQNETGVGIDQFIPKIDKEDEQELIPFPANTGYFYEWDSLRNTLSVRTTSGYTFKSMHGYMVQFTGTVGFSGSSIQPASPVAARRTKLNRDNYTIELQLLQNNNRVSRTYVELREEACDTFALNEDVYMMYSALPANLYTFAGNYDVSANVLSVNDHTIPVGITVHNAGTYTFTMPSDFNGSVTLIDNVENTRTNLALSDYEVTLPKGVCEGRFSVEIGIHKVPTSIDVIEDGGSLKDGKAHKFIMNDQMYIIKNGVIYDARGARVK